MKLGYGEQDISPGCWLRLSAYCPYAFQILCDNRVSPEILLAIRSGKVKLHVQ